MLASRMANDNANSRQSPASLNFDSNAVRKPGDVGSRVKKSTASGGILGAIKQRILEGMIDSVAGEYKILICDQAGAQILSTCLRMHELMDHNVILVEDLALDRQPIIGSPALYFISATESSVQRLFQDWEKKDMYKEVHVFFTGAASDKVVELLASHARLAERLRSLKDMLLDFSVPESLLFHLDMVGDIPKLFPPEVALSGGRENILGQVATRLVSVFHVLGCGIPNIRYQASSRLALQVAQGFYENAAKMAKDAPEFKLTSSDPNAPVLILVDRSFDAQEPVLHQRTYQCMLGDLMPLQKGMYEQEFVDRTGATEKRMAPIDELDPYWCMYRHTFFATCLEELPKRLKELLESNPSLAQGMQRGGKLAELGSAVRALPEFQEKQAKISMHIDICTKIMECYKQQKLINVCESEQDLAAERKSFKDAMTSIRQLAGDTSMPLNVRLRLLLLLIATANTREFTEAKKQQLIQDCGLMSEANRCANMDLFLTKIGRLPQPASAHAAAESATTPPATGRHSLMNFRDRGSRSPSASSTAPPAPTGDPFCNQASLIFAAVANGTLSTADFPSLNRALSEREAGVAPPSTTRAGRRTLRMGLAWKQEGAAGGPAADPMSNFGLGGPVGAHGGGGAMLDLGFEGQFPLVSSQKIVLFVLGGITYGEARAAYETAKKLQREAIVGGTSILLPETFVTQLASLR